MGLVTVTVGGIDAGSDKIATTCESGVVEGDCEELLTLTGEEETELQGKPADAYSAISGKYPKATVAVMGYPEMFGGFYLLQEFPTALNAAVDRLNDIISEQAAESRLKFVNVRLVDVRDEFKGHEIGSFRPWINYGSENVGDSANFHPSATGYYQALLHDGVIPK